VSRSVGWAPCAEASYCRKPEGADLIVETALGGGTLGVMRTWWPAQQPSLMSLFRPDSVELPHLIYTYD